MISCHEETLNTEYRYDAPLYYSAEVSRLVRISTARVRGWLEGYDYSYESRLVSQPPVVHQKDEQINDVPPFRAALGTKAWAGRFSAEFETIFQTKKSDPGPAEIVIPGFSIFRAKAAYRLDSRLSVYAVVSNLSDRTYLARPDPEAMEEPGRSLSLGLSFSF